MLSLRQDPERPQRPTATIVCEEPPQRDYQEFWHLAILSSISRPAWPGKVSSWGKLGRPSAVSELSLTLPHSWTTWCLRESSRITHLCAISRAPTLPSTNTYDTPLLLFRSDSNTNVETDYPAPTDREGGHQPWRWLL